jgi:hypothetical protein
MIETRSVTFTLPELWLMHAFVRHEMGQQEQWKLPPADEDLNEQIALAIESCERFSLAEYTLLLTRHQLLVIDYLVRYDYKTPEGARGKDILLKTFSARRELSLGLPTSENPASDKTYSDVMTQLPYQNTKERKED